MLIWEETPYWSTSPGVSFGLVCVTVLLLALCLGALPHLRNKAGSGQRFAKHAPSHEVITDQQQQADHLTVKKPTKAGAIPGAIPARPSGAVSRRRRHRGCLGDLADAGAATRHTRQASM